MLTSSGPVGRATYNNYIKLNFSGVELNKVSMYNVCIYNIICRTFMFSYKYDISLRGEVFLLSKNGIWDNTNHCDMR